MRLAAMHVDFCSWLVDGSDDAAARFEQSAQPRLSEYQNDYRSQLVAHLAEAFEPVHSGLGNEAFLAAAITHIDAKPPRPRALGAYSTGFAETVEGLSRRSRDSGTRPDRMGIGPGLHGVRCRSADAGSDFPGGLGSGRKRIRAFPGDAGCLHTDCHRLHHQRRKTLRKGGAKLIDDVVMNDPEPARSLCDVQRQIQQRFP